MCSIEFDAEEAKRERDKLNTLGSLLRSSMFERGFNEGMLTKCLQEAMEVVEVSLWIDN